MATTDAERDLAARALQALRERGVDNRCPRCRKDRWTVEVTGFVVTSLSDKSLRVPPAHVPALLMTCSQCGFSSTHNLQVLEVDA